MSSDNPVASINEAITAPAEALFNLKFHQVAIYVYDLSLPVTWWHHRGYTDWHFDQATLVGEAHGVPSTKRAEMAFNYDIMPLELEYVSYHGQRHAQDPRDGRVPFLSHLSTIVDSIEESVALIEERVGIKPYHRFTTQDHTNPKVQGIKRFREAIFNTGPALGFDIKLIQRVPWSYDV